MLGGDTAATRSCSCGDGVGFSGDGGDGRGDSGDGGEVVPLEALRQAGSVSVIM